MIARVQGGYRESNDLAERLEGYASQLSLPEEAERDIVHAACLIRVMLAMVEPTLEKMDAVLGRERRVVV